MIRLELSSSLILLASCQQTCMTYTIGVYSKKLMMDRGTVSSNGAGLVGRWAIPPGPKLKKRGGGLVQKKAPPKIWAHLGSVAYF